MAHTTQKQLEGTAARLNDMLKARGSTAHVDVQGRNGYQGVDLYIGNECQKSLTLGTKTECWDYMRAMMEALWLLAYTETES